MERERETKGYDRIVGGGGDGETSGSRLLKKKFVEGMMLLLKSLE